MKGPEPHLDAWRQCNSAALDAHLNSDDELALSLYKLALQTAIITHGLHSVPVGESLMALGDYYAVRADFIRAESAYRDAIAVYDQLFGADNAASTMILQTLAAIYECQETKVSTVLLNSFMLKRSQKNQRAAG